MCRGSSGRGARIRFWGWLHKLRRATGAIGSPAGTASAPVAPAFGDVIFGTGILDRLLHHLTGRNVRGESCRTRPFPSLGSAADGAVHWSKPGQVGSRAEVATREGLAVSAKSAGAPPQYHCSRGSRAAAGALGEAAPRVGLDAPSDAHERPPCGPPTAISAARSKRRLVDGIDAACGRVR